MVFLIRWNLMTWYDAVPDTVLAWVGPPKKKDFKVNDVHQLLTEFQARQPSCFYTSPPRTLSHTTASPVTLLAPSSQSH